MSNSMVTADILAKSFATYLDFACKSVGVTASTVPTNTPKQLSIEWHYDVATLQSMRMDAIGAFELAPLAYKLAKQIKADVGLIAGFVGLDVPLGVSSSHGSQVWLGGLSVRVIMADPTSDRWLFDVAAGVPMGSE